MTGQGLILKRSMRRFSKYSETLGYMYSQLPMYQRQGISAFKKDLTNIAALCEMLGQPQQKFKSIHVAGTNGKGTVSHLIALGLGASNYKTGLYTSPHYKDFRERIKIGDRLIPKSYVVNFMNEHFEVIEEIKPSFFEITVALAFSWFGHEKVDFAVIEVGLGGRLDSTNIINPLLSVITNISFDHMDMLGDTLPLIAGEKAGIIKKDIPVIIGEWQEEVISVFQDKALKMNSPLTVASDHYSLRLRIESQFGKTYSLAKDGIIWIEEFQTDLIAPFHEKNLITAFAALDKINEIFPLNFSQFIHDLPHLRQKVNYIGRWQFISASPEIMVDSAHNEGGLKYVSEILSKMVDRDLHIILGFVNDKDLSKVLPLFPKYAKYYFAKANIPRGLDAKILKDKAEKFELAGSSYTTVRKALSAAKRSCSKNGFIFVGGSIFVVAEVI